MRAPILAALLALALASTTGCALLTKAEPTVPRYFTPEGAEAPAEGQGQGQGQGPSPSAAPASALSIRIGRVGGSAYLKERIAHRDSAHEFGFYEDKRWTERPEVYLQRAIERALFETRGLKRALSPAAPTLTVDLIEFEEIRGASPRVRLRVSYALHDERTVYLERSFALERPLPAGSDELRPDRVASGLGEALRDAVARMVDEVIADLTARRSSPTWKPAFAPSVVIACAVGVSIGGGCRSARAQGNDRSAPTGGRSALMGNTGVALAEDGAAPFLNPATIVRIDDNALAFSVNFFAFSLTNFNHWHQPGAVDTSRFGNLSLTDTSVSTNGFNVLPSTLCLFFTLPGISSEGDASGLHKGRQKVAVCIGNVEASSVGLGALAFNAALPNGPTAQVQTFSSRWNRLYVGPSYSLSFTDDFAVGLSLHAVATDDTFDIEGSSITATSATNSIQSSLGTSGSAHAVDVTALLGAIYRAGVFTLGASFQLPSLHVFGNYNGALHNEYADGTSEQATQTSGSGSFKAPPPVRASLGVGFELKRLVMELDGSYDFPISNVIETSLSGYTTTTSGAAATATPFAATYSIPVRPVLNVALGGEYFVSPALSVVGGVSTNLSAVPALAPTTTLGNLVPARTNSASASLGLGSYGKGGPLLLGVQLTYGWGEAVTANPYVVPNEWAVVDTQTYSAMVILAGATNLRAITRAITKVEKLITTGVPGEEPPTAKPLPATPLPTSNPPKPDTAP